jgi:hypothetical protein
MSAVIDTNNLPDMSASMLLDFNASGELTPVRSRSATEGGSSVCPPAPRRRARSPSEEAEASSFFAGSNGLSCSASEAEMAAYDAVVKELVTELQTRLSDLPPMPVGEPSGLQRQQAVDPNAPRLSAPVVMDSPDVVYMLPAVRQVSAELDLAARAESRREIDSEAGDQPASPLKRRETDIECDLAAVSGATAESNASEEEEDGAETEEVSGDESDGDEADTEDGVEEVVHHVEEAMDTNTDGLFLSFHRQKGGDLAVRLEAPVWMLGVLMAAVTAYMWLVVFLIKNK